MANPPHIKSEPEFLIVDCSDEYEIDSFTDYNRNHYEFSGKSEYISIESNIVDDCNQNDIKLLNQNAIEIQRFQKWKNVKNKSKYISESILEQFEKVLTENKKPTKLQNSLLLPSDYTKSHFTCDICKESFLKFSSMKNHMNIHRICTPIQCDICCKSFTSKHGLKLHMPFHTGQSLCTICKKIFSRSNTLKHHIQHYHLKEKTNQCHWCSKTFFRYSDLQTHQLIHTGERPHVCQVCQMTFNRSGNLKAHMLSHIGGCPYVCNVCSKKFVRLDHLKLHESIHTNVRPFSCDICQKTFNRKSHIKSHMFVHSRQRDHICELCKKGFPHSYSLKSHMITHATIKPYVCIFCSKQFGQFNAFKQHLKIHDK